MTAIGKQRISSIDLMRGIVMVIMALDHTRDFFHVSSFAFDPTDPAKTTPMLFFTRWITHYCAPAFVFLAGTSIRISQEKKSLKELSRFLLTRGIWLVILEFTVVRFSFFFNLYYDFTVVQVIYALGVSMILLAALIHLKMSTLLTIGIVITVGHDALAYFRIGPDNPFFGVATMIYQGGPMQVAPGKIFMVGYPFLPWLGIMLLGYAAGQWYLSGFERERRQRLLMIFGAGGTLAFIIVRALNFYGDPVPWQTQETGMRTFLSFLNCAKYPASLSYILMTLGPTLVTMALLEKVKLSQWKPLEVFGRVPMFYYIAHFYLVHVLAIATFLVVRHKGFADLNFHFSTGGSFFAPDGAGYFGGIPIGSGYSLLWVYVAWITVVLLCYPACVWYNRYKSNHRQWWLSYL